MRFIVRHVLGLTGALILTAAVASAQEEKAGPPEKVDATALAKQTQNPVADLVSIPFQFNFNSGGGLGDGTLYNLNIQPVIPIASRFGGSHAQRDLLDLTVMEAALRLPDPALARAISAERRAMKPNSPHARSMFDRARALLPSS